MTRRTTALLAGLVVLTTACATARQKREAVLTEGMDALVYTKPLDEVWNAARQLLAERDFPLKGEDARATGQKTSWVDVILSPAHETTTEPYDQGLFQQLTGEKAKPGKGDVQWLDTGWNYYGERYHLEAKTLIDGIRVTYTKIKANQTNYTFTKTRDLDMELDLARRLDPEAATQIEARVEGMGK